MLGVLLGDAEAEHVAVEALRRLLVGHPEKHMPDARQLDHRFPPAVGCVRDTVHGAVTFHLDRRAGGDLSPGGEGGRDIGPGEPDTLLEP